MISLADFGIKIALIGAGAAAKGLGDVGKGMTGVVDSSLAAKAAIAGVLAGLERLTGYASQVGMDLYKFGVTTGLSTDELQKWQYMAQRFDVSGEEMAGTIKGVQQSMSDMLMGKGSPEALGVLSDYVGFDPAKARDTFYVMGKIQEFAKKAPPDIANNLLKSFGINDNVFQMLKSGNMEVDKLAKKKILNKDEIGRLVEINKVWKDFWFNLKTMSTKFIGSETFGQFFKVVEKGLHWIEQMVEKFGELGEESGAFSAIIEALDKSLDVFIYVMDSAAKMIKYFMDQWDRFKAGKDILNGMFNGEQVKGFKESVSGAYEGVKGFLQRANQGYMPAASPMPAGAAVANPLSGGAAAWNRNKEITQTNTIHVEGAQDPNATANAINRKINDASRQLSSQGEGLRGR